MPNHDEREAKVEVDRTRVPMKGRLIAIQGGARCSAEGGVHAFREEPDGRIAPTAACVTCGVTFASVRPARVAEVGRADRLKEAARAWATAWTALQRAVRVADESPVVHEAKMREAMLDAAFEFAVQGEGTREEFIRRLASGGYSDESTHARERRGGRA